MRMTLLAVVVLVLEALSRDGSAMLEKRQQRHDYEGKFEGGEEGYSGFTGSSRT